jgi:nitrogen PTS system EIIA component
MRLADLVRPGQVVADLSSRGKLDVLDELAGLLGQDDESISVDEVHRILVDRERLRSTGVGSGVAIPHGKVPGLEHLSLAVGVSKGGIDFEAADGKPVYIFMALVAPVSSTGLHLKALARIARICSDDDFRKRMLSAKSDDEAYAVLISEDEKKSHS